MASSKATVRVQLVRLMNVETRRPLDQVQNPQHHNHSLLRDQPEHVLGDVLLHTSQLSLAIPL